MSHAENIIRILNGRGGFDHWWHDIEREDKADVLQEIDSYLSGAEGCAEKRLEKMESQASRLAAALEELIDNIRHNGNKGVGLGPLMKAKAELREYKASWRGKGGAHE